MEADRHSRNQTRGDNMETTTAINNTYGQDSGLRTYDELGAFLGETPSFLEHLWAMVEVIELLDEYDS